MTPEQLAKSGTEHGHQRAFFDALRKWNNEVYEVTFAIPNGGARGDSARSNAIRGAALKAEGVKAGVPDVMVAWPFTPFWSEVSFAGLFVEMKRPADREKDRAKGRLGKEQEPWHGKLRAKGYAVVVAYTWDEALEYVKQYFGVGSGASSQAQPDNS